MTGRTQRPITRVEGRAVKKGKEKTVSLCPWREGQRRLLRNIYRAKNTAAAQHRDVLKHGDRLHLTAASPSTLVRNVSRFWRQEQRRGSLTSRKDFLPKRAFSLAVDSIIENTRDIIPPSTGQNRLSGHRFLSLQPFLLNPGKEFCSRHQHPSDTAAPTLPRSPAFTRNVL